MIGLGPVYVLVGLFLGVVALRNALDPTNPRRLASATFWGLLAAAFLCGDRVPKALVGGLVLVLALLAGGVRGGKAVGLSPEVRRASAQHLGSRLLWPSLLIPALAVLGTFGLKALVWKGRVLVDPTQATLLALALACGAALALALLLTRERPAVALEEGRHLLDAIGWAALLPLLLATLGAVFTASGVGQALAQVIQRGLPMDLRLVALLAFALGMTLLTMVMGNAFAAFPVMMGGLGIPVLVKLHGADPAALAALGMLSGYCGTLLTPMAANFNLVPAALLELEDPHGVIKAQAPTAFILWGLNVAIMWVLVFR